MTGGRIITSVVPILMASLPGSMRKVTDCSLSFEYRKIVLRSTPIMRVKVQHPTPYIPASMIFNYVFLSNRIRGDLLLKDYKALEWLHVKRRRDRDSPD
ncbi:hypothetical protein HMPREF9687_05197 [Klebsiella oxytoca 10-5243]|jgi:hypothetical protein|nr:hypothetical protein HMPREF9687_05197 [Klebsiella oxytoca 10-5243]